jgi:CheY-like chemotaxis protein
MTYTVLLVEDNPADILLMQRVFQAETWRHISLQILKNGNAALAYLEGEGEYGDRDRYPLPVLILLDWNLPGRSGAEILIWLKQQPILKRLPIIILSSSGEKNSVNRAYDLGANSYLVKPTGIAMLTALLNNLHTYWFRLSEKPTLDE